jgi:hypothetical protein
MGILPYQIDVIYILFIYILLICYLISLPKKIFNASHPDILTYRSSLLLDSLIALIDYNYGYVHLLLYSFFLHVERVVDEMKGTLLSKVPYIFIP